MNGLAIDFYYFMKKIYYLTSTFENEIELNFSFRKLINIMLMRVRLG